MALYKDDIGISIDVDLTSGIDGGAMNLTNAVVTLIWRKPSGIASDLVMEIRDPRRGKVRYTTVNGDLDLVGIYRYQLRIEAPGGVVYHSSMGTVEVLEPLVAT